MRRGADIASDHHPPPCYCCDKVEVEAKWITNKTDPGSEEDLHPTIICNSFQTLVDMTEEREVEEKEDMHMVCVIERPCESVVKLYTTCSKIVMDHKKKQRNELRRRGR